MLDKTCKSGNILNCRIGPRVPAKLQKNKNLSKEASHDEKHRSFGVFEFSLRRRKYLLATLAGDSRSCQDTGHRDIFSFNALRPSRGESVWEQNLILVFQKTARPLDLSERLTKLREKTLSQAYRRQGMLRLKLPSLAAPLF